MTTGATIGTSSGTTVNSGTLSDVGPGPGAISPREDDEKLLQKIKELETEVKRLKAQA